MKSYSSCVKIQMKAIEIYFHVVLFIMRKMVLTDVQDGSN